MKSFILIAFSCFLSLVVFGQPLQEKHAFSLTHPAGTSKIDKQELKNIIEARSILHSMEFADSVFRNDKVIMWYRFSKDINLTKRSMERRKSEVAYIAKNLETPKLMESNIITINNMRFLVSEYQEGDDRMLSFGTDYGAGLEFLYGKVQYKAADEKVAKKYLQTLLEGIRTND